MKRTFYITGGDYLKQDKRIELFLKELNELKNKYNIEITAEDGLILYDLEEGEYIGEFGNTPFNSEYRMFL